MPVSTRMWLRNTTERNNIMEDLKILDTIPDSISLDIKEKLLDVVSQYAKIEQNVKMFLREVKNILVQNKGKIKSGEVVSVKGSEYGLVNNYTFSKIDGNHIVDKLKVPIFGDIECNVVLDENNAILPEPFEFLECEADVINKRFHNGVNCNRNSRALFASLMVNDADFAKRIIARSIFISERMFRERTIADMERSIKNNGTNFNFWNTEAYILLANTYLCLDYLKDNIDSQELNDILEEYEGVFVDKSNIEDIVEEARKDMFNIIGWTIFKDNITNIIS